MKNSQIDNSRVVVLGAGVMGRALARAIHSAGFNVTVWNRTAANALPLKKDGIDVEEDLLTAVSSAQLIVACMLNYETSATLLHTPEIEAALKGKTLASYTTSVGEEARRWGDWASRKGIQYLDGALMDYPGKIGTADALILVSGEEAAYQQHRKALESLGGRATYVGSDPAAAGILDSALLIYHWGHAMTLYEASIVAQAQGIELDSFTTLVREKFLHHNVRQIDTLQTMVSKNSFKGDQASLDTHLAALEGVHGEATSKGAPSEFRESILGAFRGAVSQGRGKDELATVYDFLRKKRLESPAKKLEAVT